METDSTQVKFEENIENIIKETPNVDLSIIILKNDKLSYINFGKANENSLFPIASLTKPIVSRAFLELLEEKNIDINTKIEEFDIKFLNKNFENKITLKHLLTHRSGIKNTGKLFNNNNVRAGFMPALSLHLNNLLNSLPTSLPGDFSYSNNNYNILKFIIEKIANKSFEEFINKFLKKTNMTSTGYSTDESVTHPNNNNDNNEMHPNNNNDNNEMHPNNNNDNNEIHDHNERHGCASLPNDIHNSNNIHGHLYDLDENQIEIKDLPNNEINNPSFNLISTPKDMASFLKHLSCTDAHLLDPSKIDNLIMKETILESGTTLSFNYENTADGYFLDHNGLLATGFQSYLRVIPKEDLAFCILANDILIDINGISDEITKFYTAKNYKHNFIPPINSDIHINILDNIELGFYKGYETGIIELYREENSLFLNMFEVNYEIKHYDGNKFYFYNNGMLIEVVIDFETNKLFINSDSLIKVDKPKALNKSKIARKLKGVYKHKEGILTDLEVFTEYDQENIRIFLYNSKEEFEIFLLDSEYELIIPDYGHLILKYNANSTKIIGFEEDGFEEYIKE